MSIGPHRTSYGFSTIPSTSNPLSRQHMMNAPAFQQVMTLVPSPNPSLSTQTNPKNNNSSNSSNNAALSRHSGAGGNAQTLYCDNCQTFRHISFFQEKDFKYNVCRLCSEREMQKRMVNKERYEQYEEQQKNLKHNRYPISPYSQQQQQHQHQQQQQQTTTSSAYTPNQTSPLFPGSSANSPPQTSSQLSLQLPQMPINLGGNNPANLPPPPNLATPNNSNHPSPQLNASSSSMMLGMNMNNSKSHLFPVNNTNRNDHHQQQQQIHMHQIIQPPLPLPPRSKATPRLSSTSSSSSAVNVDLISLDEFVEELKKHVDFDRKLYHLDIQPLMEGMGSSAGFSQLGRGICEKVLEGTRFNFSLKDRRKSTKSPDTLSTLRYYCSQRIDTAKPRKAEHPKAQLKYNCAGALTIIIDLSKKSAHVTVIHKHAHPPFISHHHQSKSTTPAIQRTRPPPPPPPPQPDQPDQRQLRMIKQQQIHQRFDALRQRLSDMDRLLESQRQYANEDFLNVANEALSDVSEMVQACKTVDSSGVIYPPNKYTLHYNKRGDLL
ncbi:hypothetical protein G6F47_009316 [Rhizopus delemar]|nr:hypothetical protein G6F54_008148 [Rhizopus delemar]KAG1582485.1 hypothetical protein G6F48_009134 [Rhizopus delemar]KAG1592804.1 hypothetical protein G6F47_009316 [Rhizopus delemar]KAG1638330.1 hypothetical protein G6F44_008944 [Rhizopus delemar]